MGAATGAAIGALALAACATLPPQLGAAPTPLARTQLGLKGPQYSPAPDAWWQALGDPQLDRLMSEALRDNPRLAEANARWQDAEAQAAAAAAARLPDARLKASEERLKVPSGFGPYLLGGHTVWYGSLGAALSWDPDLWGEHADQAAAVDRLSDAAGMDRAEARLLLSGALVEAYLQLDRAYALQDIAADTEAQRARIVEITRRRVAAGLDTRVELREAEGAVPQTHLALLQAQAQAALARHELAALVGQGAELYGSIQRPHLDVTALQALPASLPINLLARRPDVIAARQRIAAADAQRSAARAAFYPSINLAAFVGFASVSLSNLISAQSLGYGAGPALSLPIFDGGRLRANLAGADARYDEAVAHYNSLLIGAMNEVSDLVSALSSVRTQIALEQRAKQDAQKSWNDAMSAYKGGVSGPLTPLASRQQLLLVDQRLAALRSQQADLSIRLIDALGGGYRTPQ